MTPRREEAIQRVVLARMSLLQRRAKVMLMFFKPHQLCWIARAGLESDPQLAASIEDLRIDDEGTY